MMVGDIEEYSRFLYSPSFHPSAYNFLSKIEIINAAIAAPKKVFHAGLFSVASNIAPAPRIAASPYPMALILIAILILQSDFYSLGAIYKIYEN